MRTKKFETGITLSLREGLNLRGLFGTPGGSVGELVQMPDDQPGPRVGFWNSVRRKWIGTPNNDPALSLTEIFASGMSMDEIRAAWKSRLAAATLGRSRSEKKAAAARINGKKGGRPLPEGARIARVFEDVGGYYVCDEDGPMYTGGRAHGTKAAALRAAAREGYTHATGSGCHWSGVRSIARFA